MVPSASLPVVRIVIIGITKRRSPRSGAGPANHSRWTFGDRPCIIVRSGGRKREVA